MRKEVEENQGKCLDELRDEKDKLSKALGQKSKENEVIVKELETLRENVWNLNKNNSDLNIQLDAKRNIIKGPKETLSAKDPEIIEVNASNVNMTKGQTSHDCNACDKKI